MSASQPSVTARRPPAGRYRWLLWAVLAVAGIAALVALLVVGTSRRSAAVPNTLPISTGADDTWAAGVRPAPGFSLTDQGGRAVSLAAFRGRPAIVTFIDPLCRDFCPLEAKVLSDLESSLPAAARPAILAVSTNVYGNARVNLLRDVRKWRAGPEWHWAVGAGSKLAPVWSAYHVAVLVTTKRVAGVTVHTIAHTEAAYLVDASGHERALFLWPFSAAAVRASLKTLS
ncbi:MAG: SCO family protein [Gaiellaceae bacterium]